MPVQIIRGSGARHQGSPPPSRPQHVEQPAPLGHSPTHPPTHPSHAPSVSKISTGLGCLVQIAGHHGMEHPNPPHGRVVSKSVLTWVASSRAGVFVQNLLDMDGESKSSSRAGRLAKSSLTWTCCAATPSRHHHVQQPAPLAHYATCPPTPSIMASHVPSPNHVTHLLPRECEATYPGGVTEGRVRAFTIELCLLRASQCSKWIPPVLV